MNISIAVFLESIKVVNLLSAFVADEKAHLVVDIKL